MTGVIQESVRGLLTLSGGTRNSVKRERPWQSPLIFDHEHCVFCLKQQEDEYAISNGWKTFRNSNTPFPYHRLLIPTECWDDQKLRILGGENTIEIAFSLSLREIMRTRVLPYPMWIYPHVGYGAGQNIAHNHWHLCEAPTKPKSFFDEYFEQRVTLWDSARFNTALFGVRAGHCVISPREKTPASLLFSNDRGLLTELASETSCLINRFNRKFLNPDYCILLALNSEYDWCILYLPTLNNWGGSEWAAIYFGTPFVQPWPHEATRDFLLAYL